MKRQHEKQALSLPEFIPSQHLITKEQLETPRTAAEIMNWYISIVQTICKSTEGYNAFILAKGYLKELKEESFPLAVLGKEFFHQNPDIDIIQKIGNQNYDAKINYKYKPPQYPTKFIEITSTLMDEQEHLRNIIISEKGHAGIYDSYNKLKNMPTASDIRVNETEVDHSNVLDIELSKINKIIEKKCSKNYPKNTALVISIDNIKCFYLKSDLAALRNLFETKSLLHLSNFTVVFIVGTNGKLLLKFFINS